MEKTEQQALLQTKKEDRPTMYVSYVFLWCVVSALVGAAAIGIPLSVELNRANEASIPPGSKCFTHTSLMLYEFPTEELAKQAFEAHEEHGRRLESEEQALVGPLLSGRKANLIASSMSFVANLPNDATPRLSDLPQELRESVLSTVDSHPSIRPELALINTKTGKTSRTNAADSPELLKGLKQSIVGNENMDLEEAKKVIKDDKQFLPSGDSDPYLPKPWKA
jgi:hypothetical protein